MRNKLKAAFMVGVLFCVILLGGTGIAAEDTRQSENQVFDIDAQLLSSDSMTYDVQLTVSNRGEDWEGTVRVQMDVSYDILSCAYDTVISLPQGSKKQFVVSIPVNSVEYRDATMKVSLLDRKSDTIAEKTFRRFLLDGTDALSLGILSDSYRSLTYFDMGGEVIYYGGVEFPINLVELDQDDLASSLDFLQFLVIDDYNTSVLTDKSVQSIIQWVYDGGMLIVGTGARAEDTLSGLDFLEVECIRVNEPGESVFGEDYGAGLAQLSLAELEDRTGRYYTDPESLIMASSWGDGAAELVPYALSDLAQPGMIVDNWLSYVRELLQNANSYVRILPDYNNQYNNLDYIARNIFRSFGNGGNRLNFGGLKFIVVVYAIFVGPILYLILRAVKKRDWYWAAVPVTVLVGILLVYIAGRGFEVVNTRVYSVTVERLSGQAPEKGSASGAVTYLHCYDAGHKEWGLQLADRYDYAGPIFGSYSYGSADGKYRYHICREGDRLSLGMDPDRGFEDSYFLAGTSRKMAAGGISSDLQISARWGITGTVTNETDRDFKYFAVIVDNVLFIYDDLPAGETRTLEEPVYTSRQKHYDTVMEAYRQDYMNDYDRRRKKDFDTIAALGTGLSVVVSMEDLSGNGDSGGTVIIGIAENWEKTVDDDCSETAYGCLYAVQ